GLGWTETDPETVKVIGKMYFGSLDKDGGKKVADEFAADILQSFGIKTLLGTKIYFVSDRTGAKEIWSMDFDGSNQQQLTNYKTITQSPAVSGDGKWLGYTKLVKSIPGYQVMVQSTETRVKTPFGELSEPGIGRRGVTPHGEQ